MNIPFFIARRYLFARKSTQAINIISLISVAGIFIGTAALIIILSVFNGFEQIALSMYNSFSPDLKIEAKRGKVFDPSPFRIAYLDSTYGKAVETLEEKALLVYGGKQYIATLKGYDKHYEEVHALDTMMVEGDRLLQKLSYDYAVVGAGIRFRLGISTKDLVPLEVYSPERHSTKGVMGDFNRLELIPAGVFSVQEEYDEKYVLTSLRFMRRLTGEQVAVSSVDIYLNNPKLTLKKIRRKIVALVGEKFFVRDRFQQNELLFKTLNSEKWAVFLVLFFVLLIAIFNVMGSLTMLVIEKQEDLAILKSVGMSKQGIRQIFLLQGMMISVLGGLMGLTVGAIVCLLQQKYGFVKIGAAKTFVVDSYPVVLKWKDFMFVMFTFLVISYLASLIASSKVAKSSGASGDSPP